MQIVLDSIICGVQLAITIQVGAGYETMNVCTHCTLTSSGKDVRAYLYLAVGSELCKSNTIV